MTDLISIIVPVYNSSQYLMDCIKSVIKQTYTKFELILIDDGSKDNSRNICENMCKLDSRLRLICLKHRGVSAARNAGISKANGKYLFFLDSDDMIHPRLIEILYYLQEEMHTVVAAVGQYCVEGKYNKLEDWRFGAENVQESFYLDNEKAIKYLIWENREFAFCGIGGKLIRRDAVKLLRFDEKLMNGEDTLFIYRLFEGGADAVVFNCNWYYYRKHRKNASKKFSVRTCQSRYKVNRYICNHEIKSGRIDNAIHLESILLYIIITWYKIGRKNQDIKLLEFIWNLSVSEISYKIFTKVAIPIRILFYLFMCFMKIDKIVYSSHQKPETIK